MWNSTFYSREIGHFAPAQINAIGESNFFQGRNASHGIALLNRLEQLKLQRRDLIFKRPLIFPDPNVENAIDLVDAEIKSVQRELAKIARSKRKESQK
jgi:hypothetical protein